MKYKGLKFDVSKRCMFGSFHKLLFSSWTYDPEFIMVELSKEFHKRGWVLSKYGTSPELDAVINKISIICDENLETKLRNLKVSEKNIERILKLNDEVQRT